MHRPRRSRRRGEVSPIGTLALFALLFACVLPRAPRHVSETWVATPDKFVKQHTLHLSQFQTLMTETRAYVAVDRWHAYEAAHAVQVKGDLATDFGWEIPTTAAYVAAVPCKLCEDGRVYAAGAVLVGSVLTVFSDYAPTTLAPGHGGAGTMRRGPRVPRSRNLDIAGLLGPGPRSQMLAVQSGAPGVISVFVLPLDPAGGLDRKRTSHLMTVFGGAVEAWTIAWQ